jgi:hypothetical protein
MEPRSTNFGCWIKGHHSSNAEISQFLNHKVFHSPLKIFKAWLHKSFRQPIYCACPSFLGQDWATKLGFGKWHYTTPGAHFSMYTNCGSWLKAWHSLRAEISQFLIHWVFHSLLKIIKAWLHKSFHQPRYCACPSSLDQDWATKLGFGYTWSQG